MIFSRQSCRRFDEGATPTREPNLSKVTEASIENQGTRLALVSFAGAKKQQLDTTPRLPRRKPSPSSTSIINILFQ
jgi:hypothetical protein